ncbi:amidohydrolase [Mycobacterium sp. 21AC1]|uniref:amidohydrolase family protein n=1 Tax=[Mycobacterium] appelbergii TaxID=2939269 RepID=UPI002939083C|nr:amidohydrolase family protein [Mycobacterium sp. 21AC1]MDV3128992.1 amidohydrolase [Mycobacterium sp. 21AC1]
MSQNDDHPAGLVDVHAHFTTPGYITAAKAAGHRQADGMPESYWPQWSRSRHLELMEEAGISRTLLSMSSPGVHFGDDAAARSLAREVNVFAAEAVREHPDAFGFFATVPSPAVDAALEEASFAIDELGAEGVILLSNSRGHYLGDARLDPLLAELNRRKTIVFVHPTSCIGHEELACGRPRPMIEFLFDTARTVVDLILSGAAERCPDIRFIIPHGAGVLPLLADRVQLFQMLESGASTEPTVADLLAGFWYELAGTTSSRQVQALRSIARDDRLLYGSDYPWTPSHVVTAALQELDQAFDEPGSAWRNLSTDNARTLLADKMSV